MRVRWCLALLALLGFSGCAVQYLFLPPRPPDFAPDDYAVGRARPYPQEALLAEKRLRNFVRRANAQQLAQLATQPVVAVQAYELRAGDDFPLTRQLASGKLQAVTLYSRDIYNRTGVAVQFLLLFDVRSGNLVKPDGVLVIDTPNRGKVGLFGGVHAIYAGTGFW